MDFKFLLQLAVLSFSPSIFWAIFFYYFSPRKTTPKIFLALLFLGGVVAAFFGMLAYQSIIQLLPAPASSIFQTYVFSNSALGLQKILAIFILMFFLVAPIEEVLKFFIARLAIKARSENFNQVVDGIKIGVALGLGFAVVENALYFYQPLANGQADFLVKLFLLRFFISTLGHALYGGIMGYYIGLAHFYKLYSRRFLARALLATIIIHGIFDFLFLVNFGYFSVAILVIALILLIKWLYERRNLENFILQGQYSLVRPPFFSERMEFESLLAINNIKYNILQKFNICPFCFKKKSPGQKTCSYCKREQPS